MRYQLESCVGVISAKLRELKETGENNIDFLIPIDYSVPGWSQKDIELFMIAELKDKFKNRAHYEDTHIEQRSDGYHLIIKWYTGLTDDEREKYRKILAD